MTCNALYKTSTITWAEFSISSRKMRHKSWPSFCVWQNSERWLDIMRETRTFLQQHRWTEGEITRPYFPGSSAHLHDPPSSPVYCFCPQPRGCPSVEYYIKARIRRLCVSVWTHGRAHTYGAAPLALFAYFIWPRSHNVSDESCTVRAGRQPNCHRGTLLTMACASSAGAHQLFMN